MEDKKIRRADTGVRKDTPGGYRARGRDKKTGWQIKKIPPAAPYPEQGRYRAAGFSSLICFCLQTAHLQRKINRCGDAFPMRQAGQNLRLTAAPKVRAA